VKALTLLQPWASAVALGFKRIETRSWATRYRGPLVIHAARTTIAESLMQSDAALWQRILPGRSSLRVAFQSLPRGAAVALVDLVDCVSTNDRDVLRAACRAAGGSWHPTEPELGNYERGRWAWILRDVRPLSRPVPMRGYQSLWDLSAEDQARVQAALGEPAAVVQPGDVAQEATR
jgi:hypothetical protein